MACILCDSLCDERVKDDPCHSVLQSVQYEGVR